MYAGTRNLIFALAAAFLFFPAAKTSAQSQPLQINNSERQLFASLNHEREIKGLPALQWDDVLFKAARQHALRMVNLNMLEHQLPSEPKLEERLSEAGARFGAIAENIAVGPNPLTIHSGWVDSPGHRKNILDPRFTSVGIAAVRGTNGLFAVEDFSQTVALLSREEQERKISSVLSAMGLRVNNAPESARKTCEKEAGFQSTGARAMIRFEVSDLSKLPEEIERKIRSQPYYTAAVGACSASGGPGFARYRIAVLFF